MTKLLFRLCCLSALLFFLLPLSGYSQETIKLQGKITDEKGEFVPGVTVLLKGTSAGTVSDAGGNYTLNTSVKSGTLVFSFLGFTSKSVAFNGAGTYNVTLLSESKSLSEVVVVGYGTLRKKDLTGAITSVSSKDIQKVTSNSVDKALQGQVAGLQISNTSGAPGGNTTIQMRGISSVTGGFEPLFVIDGFPVAGVGSSNPLSTINPADIESVDVLKDASSTAIYGSRGSNGVIIVTTKRGKAGTPRINFDVFSGVQNVAHKVDLMNAQQFASFIVDGRNAGHLENPPSGNTNPTINDPNTMRGASFQITDKYKDQAFLNSIGEGTDWQDQIFRTAPISSYQLSASGGTEAVRYSISGGHLNQDGIVLNTNFKRFNFSANIDAKLTDKLNAGISFLPSYTADNSPQINGHYGGYGIIVSALGADPTIPVYNPDGTYASSVAAVNGNAGIANPIQIANEYKIRLAQTRILSNAYAEYAILPSLKLKTTIGTDLNYYKRREFKPSTLVNGPAPSAPFANAFNTEATNWLSETTLSYKIQKNKHNISAVAGFSAQREYIDSLKTNVAVLADNLVQNVNGGNLTTLAGQGESIFRHNILSFLSRVNYVYNDKYLVTASIRRDGSSRFGKDKFWGNFPSAAIGWRVSQEKFMKPLKFISDFKLRASYGATGNNAIGDYRALAGLANAAYVIGDQTAPGTVPSNLPNPVLGWESQTQLDIGADISLFNNRISIVADYYDKRNKDMLFPNVETPSVTGFTRATLNIGEVQNKGFEFTLNTRNLTRKFLWNTNFNITFNKNEVLELATQNAQIFGTSSSANNTNVTMVGSPIGVFYGRRAIGVFNSDAEATAYGAQPLARAGDIKFKDVNDDKKIDDNDREVLATPHPRYFFGFNNSFSFKNFTLDILTSGVVGQSVYSGTFNANNSGVQNNAAFIDEARWRSADNPGSGEYGQFGRSIRGGKNNNFQYSSLFLFDASYWRIRQVNLGYTIPAKIVSKLKIQNARVYMAVNNLYTLTKYWGFDPEVGNAGDNQTVLGVDFGTYPQSRTGTLGINVTF